MKITNYKNPHASKQNPIINSWDLMTIVKQLQDNQYREKSMMPQKRKFSAPVLDYSEF